MPITDNATASPVVAVLHHSVEGGSGGSDGAGTRFGGGSSSSGGGSSSGDTTPPRAPSSGGGSGGSGSEDNGEGLLTKQTRRSRRYRQMMYRKTPGMEEECIGFSTLPNQLYRRVVKGGFYFTLIVVGESGLGKSTLVNSLFLADLYKARELPSIEDRIAKTVEIDKKTMMIEEKGVKLRLTIVDTPGFGDAVNGQHGWEPIEEYIDQQYEQYYKDECGLNRKNIVDNRVHCCLYFISPYGHGLRPVDVECMRSLHHKVNIVPVIAKADVLTPTEMHRLKKTVMREIDEHKINIYQFPECDSDEDEEFKQLDMELKASIPFSVIGSNTVVEVNGKKIRGRVYPWGIVEVDNPKHCDFIKLRTMLISTHMQDLKDMTRDVHYETYRSKCIAHPPAADTNGYHQNGISIGDSSRVHALPATEQLLQEKDEELRQMNQMLQAMQVKLSVASTSSRPHVTTNGFQKYGFT